MHVSSAQGLVRKMCISIILTLIIGKPNFVFKHFKRVDKCLDNTCIYNQLFVICNRSNLENRYNIENVAVPSFSVHLCFI